MCHVGQCRLDVLKELAGRQLTCGCVIGRAGAIDDSHVIC